MIIQHYNKKIFDWLERNVDRYDLTGRFARGTAAVDESVLLALINALDKNVDNLAMAAVEHFNSLSQPEKDAIMKAQRESWTVGEAVIGNDRQEADARRALLKFD